VTTNPFVHQWMLTIPCSDGAGQDLNNTGRIHAGLRTLSEGEVSGNTGRSSSTQLPIQLSAKHHTHGLGESFRPPLAPRGLIGLAGKKRARIYSRALRGDRARWSQRKFLPVIKKRIARLSEVYRESTHTDCEEGELQPVSFKPGESPNMSAIELLYCL
jgi:hypothetical protein